MLTEKIVNTDDEIWKDIPGYEEKYQVSNLGRVKTLKHKYKQHRGIRIVNEKILKPSLANNGYYRVSLGRNNQKLIHRLVAKAFIPNPKNKRTINHKDGNKLNNNIKNLEWNTHQENNLHAFKNNLIKTSKKVICLETKTIYNSISAANKEFKGNICKCCQDKKRTSGGHHFMYLEEYNEIFNRKESTY